MDTLHGACRACRSSPPTSTSARLRSPAPRAIRQRCSTASRRSGASGSSSRRRQLCRLAKEVRDLCIFSPHSVIRDPPFSRIDLVSCRNLLIYFGVDVQNQVIPTFHYALRPGGYLFLGTSENVSQFDDLFAPVEKKHRIFRRRADGAAFRAALPHHARCAASGRGRCRPASRRSAARAASRCGRRSTTRCWSGSRRPMWWSTATATSSTTPAAPASISRRRRARRPGRC